MKNKDYKMLQEVYTKMYSESDSRPKWDYDDEIKVGDEYYYAQANYTSEEHYDEGDGIWTPPTNWVEVNIDDYNGDPDVRFYKLNPETGDFDVLIDGEKEPELFKKIYDALYDKIDRFESER